jgi:tetratricopeptide (TPR) repeat protein
MHYLISDVTPHLRGSFTDDQVRREMFAAASELAYLCGWMAFDDADHTAAQRYFDVAVQLATEADDPPMAGHVLRAMAHQALDLGHRHQALALATASIDGPRYSLASPRERALLGVVHARTLAATGQHKAAISTLSQAEDALAAATSGDAEPDRVFFFSEASLAHEAACTLRDLNDLPAAMTQFQRSIRARQAGIFTRTHAVTLGYLGAVQAREGKIDEACISWAQALDAMEGVRSGRARQVANNIHMALAPYRRCGNPEITDVDARAAAYLAATS